MSSLSRRDDWPERLHAAVNDARRRPFDWGIHDCVLWACEAVRSMTGVDWADGWRGTYDDERSAARKMREIAGRGLPELAAKYAADFQCDEIPVKQAGRGDVVMVDTNLGPALGIVIDHRVAIAAPDGLAFLPVNGALKAWRI